MPKQPSTEDSLCLCGACILVFIAIGTILSFLLCTTQFAGRKRRRQVYFRRLEQFPINGNKISALVLGGNGSLGKAIVKCLLDDGKYKVHSLDLWIPDQDSLNPQVNSYVQADITNLNDLVTAFEGIDTVFHMASVLPQLRISEADMYRINMQWRYAKRHSRLQEEWSQASHLY